jgi:hypothetical protein
VLYRILRREARGRVHACAPESVVTANRLFQINLRERIAKKSPAVKETGFQVSGFKFQVSGFKFQVCEFFILQLEPYNLKPET